MPVTCSDCGARILPGDYDPVCFETEQGVLCRDCYKAMLRDMASTKSGLEQIAEALGRDSCTAMLRDMASTKNGLEQIAEALGDVVRKDWNYESVSD